MSYRKGRRLEYVVRDVFKRRGWAVVRAAASKPVDLVCMKDGHTVVVECKHNKRYVTWGEVEPLVQLAEKAGAEPVLVLAEKRGKPVLRSVEKWDVFKP
ncbi:MAG: restriction endonuclease [Candidatus Caldarchaeum sp.]